MRLAAQAKGGFYPTPPRVVEMVASLIQARSTARGETTLRILFDQMRQRPTLLDSEERLYPKEEALVDLVAAERLQGRRVLVYATHTGTRAITGRMEDFLGRRAATGSR